MYMYRYKTNIAFPAQKKKLVFLAKYILYFFIEPEDLPILRLRNVDANPFHHLKAKNKHLPSIFRSCNVFMLDFSAISA